jgi:hypothetical protein
MYRESAIPGSEVDVPQVVPASEYQKLQHRVKHLQRLLGRKTLEHEILKEAVEVTLGYRFEVATFD